ncbi:hypothetical protein KC19_VG118900 [Ceratodon purpureus]|uniref:NADH dehydrogenase subunit 4L n=1 Tax=Ceratodon purpureus TaxID=3225 RepID=A0A8T0HP94_CERPU|nr:hypothetical protein KC19_VG118900 [Ceratodon purpureus]
MVLVFRFLVLGFLSMAMARYFFDDSLGVWGIEVMVLEKALDVVVLFIGGCGVRRVCLVCEDSGDFGFL